RRRCSRARSALACHHAHPVGIGRRCGRRAKDCPQEPGWACNSPGSCQPAEHIPKLQESLHWSHLEPAALTSTVLRPGVPLEDGRARIVTHTAGRDCETHKTASFPPERPDPDPGTPRVVWG